MEFHFSSNKTFVIESDGNGHVWLYRHKLSGLRLLVQNDREMIELFALICTFITEHVLALEWIVASLPGAPGPDDNGTDWSEDDVPF